MTRGLSGERSSPVDIQVKDGDVARLLVDPLFERNGSRARAREDDLFFLAMIENSLAGCVRYCVESGTPMLRSMMVDEQQRRMGIGLKLLQEFAAYLDRNQIQNVYCLPYAHLETFYARAGFLRVHPGEAPAFLQERLQDYTWTGTRCICMRRP